MTGGEPTQEQLTAMAYADGELDEAARSEFEKLLETRQDLALEVARVNRLNVLARQVAPPEPMDHEWKRLERDALHVGGRGLGFAALVLFAVSLVGWVGYLLVISPMPLALRLLLGTLLIGFLCLFLVTLRARLRTRPYDPYTEIRR